MKEFFRAMGIFLGLSGCFVLFVYIKTGPQKGARATGLVPRESLSSSDSMCYRNVMWSSTAVVTVVLKDGSTVNAAMSLEDLVDSQEKKKFPIPVVFYDNWKNERPRVDLAK